MTYTPNFFGEVNVGELVLYDWEGWRRYLKNFEGKKIKITAGELKKQRSLKQNSYYWGVVVETLANEFGYSDREELHDALRWKFLRLEDGKPIPVARSTRALSTKEWEEYMTKIRDWASQEFGIYIPEPNEVTVKI